MRAVNVKLILSVFSVSAAENLLRLRNIFFLRHAIGAKTIFDILQYCHAMDLPQVPIRNLLEQASCANWSTYSYVLFVQVLCCCVVGVCAMLVMLVCN